MQIADFRHLLGLSEPQYRAVIASSKNRPLDDPVLALLVWALKTWPQHNYLPSFPDAKTVYKLYLPIAGQLTDIIAKSNDYRAPPERPKKRGPRSDVFRLNTSYWFSYMLGRGFDVSSRWLAGHTQPQPSTKRLIFMLSNVCQREGVDGLHVWFERVLHDASWRGKMDKLWYGLSWRPAIADKTFSEGSGVSQRRIICEDIERIQKLHNISTYHAMYLLGQTMAKILHFQNSDPRDPIPDRSLSLLVWALLTYPQYSYQIQLTTPSEAFDAYCKTVQPIKNLPREYYAHDYARILSDPKRRPRSTTYQLDTPMAFALMLGSSFLLGNLWRNQTRTLPRPVAQRLITMLKSVCDHEGAKGLQLWFEQAMALSKAYGVENLWEQRQWIKPKPRK